MDIFNEDTPPVAPIVDPDKDYLTEYVGEGKKFADAKALARAKAESDAFIARILDEKRRLEEDLKTRTNMQDFLDQLKPALTPPVAQTPVTPPVVVNPGQSEAPDFEKKIQEAIEKREAEQARTRNLMDVQEKLRSTYGENYATRVKERAAELGIPVQWLNDAAAKSPKAFYELIGLNRQTQEPVRQIPGSVSLATPGGTVKNWAYYNNIRKTNLQLYNSKQVQAEMWEQAKKLGPDFNS